MSYDEPKPAYSPKVLVQRLLAMCWQYRWFSVAALAIQLLLNLLGVALIALPGLAVDLLRHALNSGNPEPNWPVWYPQVKTQYAWFGNGLMGGLLWISLGILFIAGFKSLLNAFYSIFLNRVIQGKLVVDLRAEVYAKLQSLSFSFFESRGSSSLINRVTSDVQGVRSFLDLVVLQAVVLGSSLLISTLYMLKIHPGLTVACVAPAPIIWWVSERFSRKMKPAYDKNKELSDALVQTLSEHVQGVSVVRSFGLEKQEVEKFNHMAGLVKSQQHHTFWLNSLFTPLIGFLSQSSLVILLLYGGWLVARNEIPLGLGLMTFAGLLQSFATQVSNFASIANTLQQSLTAAGRVFEVLDAPVSIQSPPHPLAPPSGHRFGEVEFRNVSFHFEPKNSVLNQVSFHVFPGERIAIWGHTGSGKSALLSLIPRFYDPANGVVMIDGLNVKEQNLQDLRRRIGIVFQESFLFSASVASNIGFGHQNPSQEQIEQAAKLAQAHDFIQNLPEGYQTLVSEGGTNFSGGQRQRIALARALILDPSILILDDPTAAVDPETEAEILKALNVAMQGRTVFIVAHRVSIFKKMDRVMVLENGQITTFAPHEELLKTHLGYQELVKLQSAS